MQSQSQVKSRLDTITLLDHRVIVRLDKTPEMKGSLYLAPETVKDQSWGRVALTGPEVASVKPGDRVLLPVSKGSQLFTENHRSYVLYDEDDLIAVIEEDPSKPEGKPEPETK